MAEGFDRAAYDERLKVELDIIEGMKFPGYFLIVADFIKWAKGNDIPVARSWIGCGVIGRLCVDHYRC